MNLPQTIKHRIELRSLGSNTEDRREQQLRKEALDYHEANPMEKSRLFRQNLTQQLMS